MSQAREVVATMNPVKTGGGRRQLPLRVRGHLLDVEIDQLSREEMAAIVRPGVDEESGARVRVAQRVQRWDAAGGRVRAEVARARADGARGAGAARRQFHRARCAALRDCRQHRQQRRLALCKLGLCCEYVCTEDGNATG